MGIAAVVAAAFVTGLSGAIMPGSLFVVVVANALNGVIPGMTPILGHAVAEAVMVTLLAFGSGKILSRPAAPAIIAVAGAIMLAWMARSLIRASLHPDDVSARAASAHPSAPIGLAVQGVAATISNPYWLLWWVTVGAGSVAVWKDLGRAGMGAFFGGHIAADIVWFLLVSIAVSKGRNLIEGKVYRGLLGVCGLFLLAMSAYFASQAIRMIV